MQTELKKGFDRSLPESFIEALENSSRSGWWSDVMKDQNLIVAFRGTYLSVYWQGQSLFKVEPENGGLRATTHEKYLFDPTLKKQIRFNGTEFDTEALERNAFLKFYEGPSSLNRMKKAAELYAGQEKKGCHKLALKTSNVLDLEIALPSDVEFEEAGKTITTPRIDLLRLEPEGDKKARLVFWEAKTFSNPDLRSGRSVDRAPVLAQIASYRAILEAYRGELEESYTGFCRASRRIHAAVDRQVSGLIDDVATGKRTLTLGDMPRVNLVIFGYDAAQRDHEAWQLRRPLLEEELRSQDARLYTVGDPNVALPPTV